MSVRDRRLESDYQGLLRLCMSNKNIKLLDYIPEPRKYVIQISNIVGVESINYDDAPVYRTQHILEISDFTLKYPQPVRDGIPTVHFKTPIFHPNVFEEKHLNGLTCIYGDNMTENQPVNLLVFRLITMIQYANTDFGSPANYSARNWYDRNKHKGWFPLGKKSGNQPPESQKVKWGKKT
jgi:ubiquitin-protein ligase